MKKIALIMLCITALVQATTAQKIRAVSYMNTIEREFRAIKENMWYYTSTASHQGVANKLESKRNELMKQIEFSIKSIERMKPFENSTRYRDSAVAFLKLNHQVLKTDFAEIVQLQNVTEKTFEQVVAYIKLQEIIDDKLAEAGRMMDSEQVIFGTTYGLTFTTTRDKISVKQEEADKVYDYYNPIYLIFFKSYLDEVNFVSSLAKQDSVAMEKYSLQLLNHAKIGLEQLAQISSFKGDTSLKVTCTEMLKFYQREVEENYVSLKTYYQQKLMFEQIKLKFDALADSARTKEEVKQYNKAVADYNAIIQQYNATNQYTNEMRNRLIANWNLAAQTFKDRHIPKR